MDDRPVLIFGPGGWRAEDSAAWAGVVRAKQEAEEKLSRRVPIKLAPTRVKQFIADFAAEKKIPPAHLVGGSRADPIMAHKIEMTALMFMAFPEAGLSQIGRWLNGLDHATIRNRLIRYCKRNGKTYPPVPEEGTLQ